MIRLIGPLTRHDPRLLPAAAIVWLATLLGIDLGWRWTIVTGCLLAAAAVAVLGTTTRHAMRVGAGAAVLCALLTAALTGYRLHHQTTNPLVALARHNTFAGLRITISDSPRPVSSAGFGGRPGGVRTVLIDARATAITLDGHTGPADGDVLLMAPARAWGNLVRGQQADAQGQLLTPLSTSTDTGTVAVLHIRGSPEHVTPPTAGQHLVDGIRAGLRSAAAGLPDADRGLLPAIVIGDRTDVGPAVQGDFRRAGMDYLMAVGGLHLMVVCGTVLWLLRRASLGPVTSAVLTALVLAGFVEVAGPRPNVLRAALMVGAWLLAVAVGRTRSTGSALSGSVIVLLLYRPEFATDIGFALSVVATGALMLLVEPVAAALERRRIPAGIAELLAIAIVAQLATLPLTAAAFGQLSLPAIVANAVAEPAFVPLMLVGTLVMAFGQLWPWLAGVIAHLAVPETTWLRVVAHHAAGLPASAVDWPTGWWGGLALAALVAALAIALRFRRLRALLAAALAGVVVVIVPIRVIRPGWPPAGWALVDCDVGQGDGEVLATAVPGRAVVVDTGPDPTAIDECLGRLGVDRVPLVVLSHLHADHVGGLAAVFHDRSVGAVAVGPSRAPAWAWTVVRRQAAAAGVPLVALSVGQRLTWPGLALDVLGPAPADAWPGGDDPSGTVVNNSSVVLRATTSAGRVLLTGDIELAAQADLLASGVDVRADILKIPHHGSRFSAPRLLDAVHARIAVASVGAGNPYGHPSPLTLDRLAADGALVLRTDHDGDIAIRPTPTGPEAIPRGDPRPPPHRSRAGP